MWVHLLAIAFILLAGEAAGDFDNCIQLDQGLRLWWTLDLNAEVATFKLCGCVTLEDSTDSQYNGFGLSGSNDHTSMLGADAIITWVNDTGAQAEDYHLNEYLQCRTGEGACPDTDNNAGPCTNDVFNISGTKEDSVQCVTYSRSFDTGDNACDLPIVPSNVNQYIVWSVGGLGEAAFKHFVSRRANADDPPIHFGRTPADECTTDPLVCNVNMCGPFDSKSIVALENSTFIAQIGQTGGDRGYMALTNQAGWGYAWYINGSLIPELTVARGKEYTFITEGGTNTANLGMYHPFYISDSIHGGRLRNTGAVATETVYAGFAENEQPIGVGRYCELKENAQATDFLFNCGTREQYEANLDADCQPGEPGVFTWIPDDNTPDLLYYQCATHQNFGWEIHVTGQYTAGGGGGEGGGGEGGEGGGGEGGGGEGGGGEGGGGSVAMASWSVILLTAIAVSLVQ